MNRELSEYFWIQFNWPKYDPDRAPRWEPASFDPNVRTWALIGAGYGLIEHHPDILKVGPRIVEPPLNVSRSAGEKTASARMVDTNKPSGTVA